jgi:hypothetical protein
MTVAIIRWLFAVMLVISFLRFDRASNEEVPDWQ